MDTFYFLLCLPLLHHMMKLDEQKMIGIAVLVHGADISIADDAEWESSSCFLFY
jgi:hypothetical protein